jgi:hypothetical protein
MNNGPHNLTTSQPHKMHFQSLCHYAVVVVIILTRAYAHRVLATPALTSWPQTNRFRTYLTSKSLIHGTSHSGQTETGFTAIALPLFGIPSDAVRQTRKTFERLKNLFQTTDIIQDDKNWPCSSRRNGIKRGLIINNLQLVSTTLLSE